MVNNRDDQPVPIQPGHLSQHQRTLVRLGLGLSWKDAAGTENRDEFRAGILEAIELLRDGRLQEAAFKIDDALMLLPVEKRANRGGAAEWAREWWDGHLAPIRLAGGEIPGDPPVVVSRRVGGSEIYLTLFDLYPDAPITFIRHILMGDVLRPHLPDMYNPEPAESGRRKGRPGRRSWLGNENLSFVLIMALIQASEYGNHPSGSPYSPWLNTVLGLAHASLGHEPRFNGVLPSLLEGLVGFGGPASDLETALKGHGHVPTELKDLLINPLERSEWARLNDEIAVRYLAKAIKYSTYESTFHLHLSLSACLTRLGRYEEAKTHSGMGMFTPTVRPGTPIPSRFGILKFRIAGSERVYGWAPYGMESDWFEGHPEGSEARSIVVKEKLTIGRANDNDIVLKGDLKISRYHAELSLKDGVIWIEDKSANGTYLNDVRLTGVPEPVTLFGDEHMDSDDLSEPYFDPDLPASEILLGSTSLLVQRFLFAGPRVVGWDYYRPTDEGYDLWPYEWESAMRGDEEGNAIAWHLGRLISLIATFTAGDLSTSLEQANKMIEASLSGDSIVPFELYHLRSEIYRALGDQKLCERDSKSADESLAAEFAEV